MTNDNIEKLKELTPKLPPLSDIINGSGDYREFRLKAGYGFMFKLYKNDKVMASRCYNSAGSIMPQHQHGAIEYVIVYEGEMHLKVNNETKILKRGDCSVIPPNTIHGFSVCPFDLWYLIIAIPPLGVFK